MCIVYQISLHNSSSSYDARDKTWPQIRSETGCKPRTEWLDPIHNRPILKGEFGCAVSHLRAWEKIAESGLKGIILEEDALFEQMNTYKVDWLLEENDSVWLGYRWNDMGYWYNCHAYAITPDTARLLIKDFWHQIIPVDEWVPAKLKGMNNYFYSEEIITQIPRSIRPSTIEDAQMKPDQNKIHVLTIGTESEKCWALNQSCNSYGVEVKNLGVGKEDFDMSSLGGMPKIELVKEYLNYLPKEDLVLFVDGYDTFFADNLDTIRERFLGFNVDILFGAEENCWPLSDNDWFKGKWEYVGTPYKFLNSGLYIGRVGALLDFFGLTSNTPDEGDDQLFCQTRFLSVQNYPRGSKPENNKFPHSIGLDYEAYIFQNHEPEIKIVNGQISNPRTNCCGCIYHGNGGPDAKELFVTMANKFGYGTGSLQSPEVIKTSDLQYEEVAQDTLVTPFLTEDQCQDLIDRSEAIGNWGQMDGDKFPAQEIRLKQLGLWKEYELMWKEHLFKICEEYWKPVEYMGLRDAFTMRYSMDTQRSLGLHTDASLITGSVKLNEHYDGATLHFPRQKYDNSEVPVGSCILFPSQVTHGHYVDDLTYGTKYSLTMWTSRYRGDEN